MKFITEEDLRDAYKTQPFTEYDPNPGERLTPGARQFLVDRGINMYDESDPFIKTGTSKPETKAAPLSEKRKKKFHSRMKSVEILFLLTAEELLKCDVCMSEQLTELYRHFRELEAVADGECETKNLCCKTCTSMNAENFSQELGNCFEITEFHMQMEKGREMLLLARLRNELAQLEAELAEFVEAEAALKQMSAIINQIINTLSQMICGALGGNECQRKI